MLAEWGAGADGLSWHLLDQTDAERLLPEIHKIAGEWVAFANMVAGLQVP